MILAEKLSQKLNNLKSKKEILDFYIFFDEYRNLEISSENGSISTKEQPTHYTENTEGYFVIIWDTEFLSTGNLNTTSVNDFDEFITHAQKTKRLYDNSVFIPERGIYPMVITYAKSLADMIDIPEYLLKLSDLTQELDKMIGESDGKSVISVRDGSRYAFSSRAMDEYYSYSRFTLDKSIGGLLSWQIESSNVFPIVKFQEVFSFLGDIFNALKKSETKPIAKGSPFDLILSPSIFQNLFKEHILDNINGQNIINGMSCFKLNHFIEKLKCLNTLSISYDPLINQKVGTYRFTNFGKKPEKQYFIKYGKLDTPVLNNTTFSKLGYKTPTMEIQKPANIKIEGLKKKPFSEAKKSTHPVVFSINSACSTKIDLISTDFYFEKSLIYDKTKIFNSNSFNIKLNLIDLIRANQVELVEFIDGQLGCKIINLRLKD